MGGNSETFDNNWIYFLIPVVTIIFIAIFFTVKIKTQGPIPCTNEESIIEDSEELESTEVSKSSDESGEEFIQEEHSQTTILITPEEIPMETEAGDNRVMDAYKYKELDKVLRNIEERTKPITAE